MALSKRLLKTLIADGEITITPYSESNLLDNRYILHNNGKISYYDDSYAHNEMIDTGKPPVMTNVAIPDSGFILEANKTYYIETNESVVSSDFSGSVSPYRDLAKYGLTVTTNGNIDYNLTGPISLMITSVQPTMIYPKQELAELYVTEADNGGAQVPIGGIIMWSGSNPPYGYYVCDGRNGTPDLRGRFIKGGSYEYDEETDTCSQDYGTGGQNQQTLTIDNLPAHSHSVSGASTSLKLTTATVNSANSEVAEGETPPEPTEVVVSGDLSSASISGTTGSVGSGLPFDNQPAYYALCFIMRIK